jgi:hypothetical protein
MRKWKVAALAVLGTGAVGVAGAAGYLWSVTSEYGFHVLRMRGGSVWTPATVDDPRISPAMRLALSPNPPAPSTSEPAWTEVMPGFESGEMAVLAGGREVDRILLSRFDPARWNFGVRNDPAGSRLPKDWIAATGAKFVINGSYFGYRETWGDARKAAVPVHLSIAPARPPVRVSPGTASRPGSRLAA